VSHLEIFARDLFKSVAYCLNDGSRSEAVSMTLSATNRREQVQQKSSTVSLFDQPCRPLYFRQALRSYVALCSTTRNMIPIAVMPTAPAAIGNRI
jgi:hypothetical protein